MKFVPKIGNNEFIQSSGSSVKPKTQEFNDIEDQSERIMNNLNLRLNIAFA